MAKEYVPIFFDWLDVTQDLTAEEKGNLIDAVVAYASGHEYEHLLTGGVRIAFRFMKGQVDRNNAISDARSEARKNKPEQNETKETKDNKPEQNTTNFPKEKEKEKEKENNNDKESVREKKPLKRFTPPKREEVAEYCRERGNNVDVERFVDYYTANGWMVGKNPMKDWRATVRTWERSDGMKQTVKIFPTARLPAQDYGQRDWSGDQQNAIDEMMKWDKEADEA